MQATLGKTICCPAGQTSEREREEPMMPVGGRAMHRGDRRERHQRRQGAERSQRSRSRGELRCIPIHIRSPTPIICAGFLQLAVDQHRSQQPTHLPNPHRCRGLHGQLERMQREAQLRQARERPHWLPDCNRPPPLSPTPSATQPIRLSVVFVLISSPYPFYLTNTIVIDQMLTCTHIRILIKIPA
jgi:hypothetical protein